MLTGHAALRPQTARRRGGVYVAVLGVSALVLVLGMGGLASARSIARAQSEARDMSGARWAAVSALELGRYAMERNARWRTQRSNGDWCTDAVLGDATVTLSAVNPSGAMNRSVTDPVDLTAVAYQGACTHRITLRLQAEATPLDSLNIPLAVGGSITATSATVNASGYTIAANGAFTALLCSINANVEAGLTATGLVVNGTMRSLAPTRALPGSDAFDFYTANGTSIPVTALTLKSGVRTFTSGVLSPNSNPLNGALNAQGVYVIDAANAGIAIGPCRIVGTLVIINASAVTLQSGVIAEPAVTNFPCIMVRGNATISTTGSTLAESSGTATNYNPSQTAYPYPNGVSNATTTDSYAPAINGLVYVSGNATVTDSPAINQLIVGGDLTLGGTLTLGYTSEYRRSPPPGFAVVRMRPAAGQWKQVVQ
jgi:hypothetical protein